MISQIKEELNAGASVDIVARRLDIPVHWVLEVLNGMDEAAEPPEAGSVVTWPFREDFNYD